MVIHSLFGGKGSGKVDLSTQLHATAVEHADKHAYVFEGKAVTYGELDNAVSRFAAGLAEMGLKKGDHVAMLLGNSPYFVIGLYGCLRLGATVIPVNPIYTADEIAYIINNGDVKAIIAPDMLVPLLKNVETLLPSVEHLIICETPEGTKKAGQDPASWLSKETRSFAQIMAMGEGGYDPAFVDPEDTAVILYTSGTTGKPKGAMLTHQNLYSNAKDTADFLQVGCDDRVLAVLPMFHVFCLTVSLNAPLMNGGTVVIMSKFSPPSVFETIRQEKITVFAGVPAMYNFLLQYPEADSANVNTLRLCISGGASMPVALLTSFEKKFNVSISEGYGLSEASPVTCFNPLDRPCKPGSIGTNIHNVENKVVDELGNEVPVGQVGELIVRGPNIMKGYYKMPEETAFTIKDGWLHTGDLAKMDEDGYFYIVDRKKDMIIVGGYNVYPREVEEVLYSHPSVLETAVIGIPDLNVGEAVKCFVVLKEPGITEDDLLAYCRKHLAKYKVPADIEFLTELPKNTTGKILRRALKQQLLSR
jgi:long-chain acyl-CoA synthetase